MFKWHFLYVPEKSIEYESYYTLQFSNKSFPYNSLQIVDIILKYSLEVQQCNDVSHWNVLKFSLRTFCSERCMRDLLHHKKAYIHNAISNLGKQIKDNILIKILNMTKLFTRSTKIYLEPLVCINWSPLWARDVIVGSYF